MRQFKFHKWFASFALLAVILSFSGFTPISTNFEKPQTELVIQHKSVQKASAKYYKSEPKLWVNQFTVFNFKSLLNSHYFNFNITLKTQKEILLQCESVNTILEQNLIAQQLSNELLPAQLDKN